MLLDANRAPLHASRYCLNIDRRWIGKCLHIGSSGIYLKQQVVPVTTNVTLHAHCAWNCNDSIGKVTILIHCPCSILDRAAEMFFFNTASQNGFRFHEIPVSKLGLGTVHPDRYFVVSWRPSRQMMAHYLESGHDHFVPFPLQFIIH